MRFWCHHCHLPCSGMVILHRMQNADLLQCALPMVCLLLCTKGSERDTDAPCRVKRCPPM